MSNPPLELQTGPLLEKPVALSAHLLHLYQSLAGVTEGEAILRAAAAVFRRAIPLDRLLFLALDEQGLPWVGVQIWHQQEELAHMEVQRAFAALDIVQQAWRENTPFVIPDTRQDAAWRGLPEAWQQMRSALWFPLRSRGGVMGVGLLARRPPRAFTSSDAAAAVILGEAVGNALWSNAAMRSQRDRAELSRLLAEGVEHLAQTLKPEEVVRGVLLQVHQALDTEVTLAYLCQRGSANEAVFVLQEALGPVPQTLIGKRYQAGASPFFQKAAVQKTLWWPNLAENPAAWQTLLPEALQVRHGYSVPIRAEGRLLGLLLALNPRRRAGMAGHAREMLSALANVAGVILNHAHLFAALQQAHEEYRTLFNDTLDWIFITDLQGYIVEANQSAKDSLGFTWEELRSGKVPITRVHTPDARVVPEDLSTVQPAPPLRYEAEVVIPEREPVPVEVYLRRVTVGGRPRLQWILRDITEAKQLETLREDLLSMVYHDLRSPLANIVSGVEELLRMGIEDETVRRVLHIVRRAAERIQRLTSTMLDIQRLEAGQPLVNPRPILPSQLIAAAVEAVQPLAEGKGHALETVLPNRPLPSVLADAEMVRRVLINLMENAVKYMEEPGRIWVGARQESEERVRFWVKDTGPGIPPEEQPRLFEKYARLSTGKRVKGIGLGLAYCRLAVEAHGGEIGVESTPGQGATFFFTLPVASSPQPGNAGG